MIETVLTTYLQNNLSSGTVQWGKIDATADFSTPQISIQKTATIAATYMPTYADTLQVSVRADKIWVAQQVANEIINLLQTYSGEMGDMRVWVGQITMAGTLYEEEDIIQVPLLIPIKYTGLT